MWNPSNTAILTRLLPSERQNEHCGLLIHNKPKKIPKSYILYKNDQIQYLYLSSAFK